MPGLMRETVRKRAKPYVCMVACTDYLTDARVRREAETLASRGFRVLCLKTSSGSTPQRYSLNGVQVRELGVAKYQGKSKLAYLVFYLRFLVAASVACVGLVLKRELDVVHVHNLPDFLAIAGLVPRLVGRKVVLDVHDSVPETFATKFPKSRTIQKALRLEESLSASIAHRVICVNEPQRDVLVARGIPRSKTFVSMNVPDPAIFGSRSCNGQRSIPDADCFNIVYHGTMAERLGVDLIIRATALLRDRIPGVRLHLWGNGDDLSSFVTLARELGVDECTQFRPEGVALEQLPCHLGRMHVGVVGNRRSAASSLMLPVKLMEYVALGIPTVVPGLAAIQHYFDDEMVSYYEPENVESFSDAIHRLYEQPALRSHQANRASEFLETFGWKRQGEEFVGLYEDLVESHA